MKLPLPTSMETAARAAVELLRIAPLSCSDLGYALWGKRGRKPQDYARPASRLIAWMEHRGLVRHEFHGNCSRVSLTKSAEAIFSLPAP